MPLGNKEAVDSEDNVVDINTKQEKFKHKKAYNKKEAQNLFEEDLANSGLFTDQIADNHIRLLDEDEAKERLVSEGWNERQDTFPIGAIEFPYFEPVGFVDEEHDDGKLYEVPAPMLNDKLEPHFRYKLLGGKAKRKDDKKPRKYTQSHHAGSRIFFPRGTKINWEKVIPNPTNIINIVEGEKPAILMCHLGEVTLAMGGIACGVDKNSLLNSDLECIDWVGRTVRIFPDHDVLHKRAKVNQSKKFLYRFVDALKKEGVKEVQIVKIPAVDNNPTTGPDDFYIFHKVKKNLSTVDVKAKKKLLSLPILIEKSDVIASDVQDANPPAPIETVIEGVIDNVLTMVSGPPKAGKTRLLTMMAGAFSVGADFCGYFNVKRPLRTAYVYSEDGAATVDKRIKELTDYEMSLVSSAGKPNKVRTKLRGGRNEPIPRKELDKLRALAKRRYNNPNLIFAYEETAAFFEEGGAEAIRKFIKVHKLEALILDMYDDCREPCPTNQSASNYDKECTRELKRIQAEENCLIILSNHSTKSPNAINHLRGGGTVKLLGGVPNLITLIPPDMGSNFTAIHIKARTMTEEYYAAYMEKEYGAWVIEGLLENALRNEVQGDEYSEMFTQHPNGMTAKEVHEYLRNKHKNDPVTLDTLTYDTVKGRLCRKKAKGVVFHADRKYWRDANQYEAYKAKKNTSP